MFLFFFSLCLFDVQLLFLNTCQKVINGVGWLDDRHGLSPILYDTAPLFVYTDQLLCHCDYTCSNVRWWLVYCMRWLLWCFCLLAESYETINHVHVTKPCPCPCLASRLGYPWGVAIPRNINDLQLLNRYRDEFLFSDICSCPSGDCSTLFQCCLIRYVAWTTA